jgi:hypothetical protein
MKNPLPPAVLVILAALAALPLASAQTQSSAAPDNLFKTIQSLDTRLFDAYNHCDLVSFSSLIAEDVEFYHDKTGLALGRANLVNGIKNNICGKVTRQLVSGSLEIYPIANYGAVEIGIHRFHHPGHEDSDSVGEAKFVQLWQNKDGNWKITRVISFDHQSVKQ